MQPILRGMLAERDWLRPNDTVRGGLRRELEERYRTGTPTGQSPAGEKIWKADPQPLWGRGGSAACPAVWLLLLLDHLGADIAGLAARVSAVDRTDGQREAVPGEPRPEYIRRHRDILTHATARSPGASRTDLKGGIRTSYLYLQRNDPAWLERQLPPKRLSAGQPVDWKARDKELVSMLAAAAEAWLRGRSERRITKSGLAEAVGFRTGLTGADPRLPGANRALARLAESKEEYRLRRLRHARAMDPAGWSVFLKRAAFRSSEFPSLTPDAAAIHRSPADGREKA